ncbi:unnamed protein product [Prorocentrum cordatum]|uniref:Uncharacterized protein n=1 Tax=Prorocentrum cordatum TaxID=2364126 RepID=A0ABN9VIP4_9DINO|nr:unnamed protein product [Polarella glacialis]
MPSAERSSRAAAAPRARPAASCTASAAPRAAASAARRSVAAASGGPPRARGPSGGELDADTDQRERVVSEGYVKEATAKTVEIEAGIDKVNAAELPFLKGLEVLPLKEAQDTITESEKVATDVSKNVTDARNYIAAKSLEVKKFAEAATKPAVEEFTKLTERINSAASKLSQFRKETEGRKKSVQLQEAGDKVEKADEEVKKLAEAIEPLSKDRRLEGRKALASQRVLSEAWVAGV